MSQRKTRYQRQLFEEALPVPTVDVPPAVVEQLRHGLMRWMLALAATMRKEAGGE